MFGSPSHDPAAVHRPARETSHWRQRLAGALRRRSRHPGNAQLSRTAKPICASRTTLRDAAWCWSARWHGPNDKFLPLFFAARRRARIGRAPDRTGGALSLLYAPGPPLSARRSGDVAQFRVAAFAPLRLAGDGRSPSASLSNRWAKSIPFPPAPCMPAPLLRDWIKAQCRQSISDRAGRGKPAMGGRGGGGLRRGLHGAAQGKAGRPFGYELAARKCASRRHVRP